MSRRIRKYSEASACKALGITVQDLKIIHTAAYQVMSEIIYDLLPCCGKAGVPRYMMIECVCDCDRLTDQFMRLTGRHVELKEKLRNAPLEVVYGVVGMALDSRHFVV